MPHAVTLRLDDAAAAQVASLCRPLAARGIACESERTGYPPHVTLAVLEDAVEEQRLAAVAAALARRRAALELRMATIGRFEGSPVFLWLGPAACTELFRLHAAVLAGLDGRRVHPHYRAGAWIPHVTLCRMPDGAEEAAGAADALSRGFAPFEAIADRIELVRFPPVAIPGSWALER